MIIMGLNFQDASASLNAVFPFLKALLLNYNLMVQHKVYEFCTVDVVVVVDSNFSRL